MRHDRWTRAGTKIAVALLAIAAAGQTRRVTRGEAELERTRRDLDARRADADRLRQTLRRQHDVLRRVESSRRAEREWNRELRTQLQRLYASPRHQPGRRDVASLILQAAIELVGAEKGMLLSREDADGDGVLDVAVAEGFVHDPETSVVAQRLAHKVLALDEIVRDDDPTAGVEALTAADREIEALVAIPVYLHDRFDGVIVCVNRPGGFEEVEDDVLLALGDQAGAVMHHGQLRTAVREAHHGAIRALLEALAARDPVRQRRSAELTLEAATLARDLGLDDTEQDVLVCATLLRDAGYLALPDGLLTQPRALRPDERAAIELHPRFGFNVIGQLPALREVATTVLYHHERHDGRGYPNGLPGARIPRTARALAVLEAYDAMTSDRPYRPALSPDDACSEIVAEAGAQFDPDIAQRFAEQVRRREASLPEDVNEDVAQSLPMDLSGRLDSFPGPLTLASTDALTLLANRRALEQDLAGAAREDGTVTVLLLQLQELADVNQEEGHDAGDRLIQIAARNAQRAAARCGGRAYRASGRRFAIVVAPGAGGSAQDPSVVLASEFVAGPAVRIGRCDVRDGEPVAAALERARAALLDDA